MNVKVKSALFVVLVAYLMSFSAVNAQKKDKNAKKDRKEHCCKDKKDCCSKDQNEKNHVKVEKTDYIFTITTKFGTIDLYLYDQTPKHKENFLKLVNEGYYNGTTFHRIIPNFMIQGGDGNSKDTDPNNDGMGGPGYTIPAEFVDALKHHRGALAAARMGDNVNPKKESSGSQFYIVQNPNGTPFLDNNYTVFGKVIKGIEVVDQIVVQPRDKRDRPFDDIKMEIKVQKMKVKEINEKYQLNLPLE